MYQHLRVPLPLEQLKDVPQPVVVLLGKLLEKDPAQRFQTPDELLKAMPTITGAIEARRGITRRNLKQIAPPASRVGTRKPRARLGPRKISVARLPITGSDVFGRKEDIGFLDDAWANQQVNVVTIVAWGGVGKSTLINHWLRRMAAEHYRSAQFVFGWSFYRAPVAALRLPMNFLMPHFTGLAIQIHGSEQYGRKAKDWRSSLAIGEPCLFWMGWSRSKIHPERSPLATR